MLFDATAFPQEVRQKMPRRHSIAVLLPLALLTYVVIAFFGCLLWQSML